MLGLLRRLRPSFETSPDLAACWVSQPRARIEVPMFKEATLGAVGGRLCPWQRGPQTRIGTRVVARPSRSAPSRLWKNDQALAACSCEFTIPYRGFQHRLQCARGSILAYFAMAPAVARPPALCADAGSLDRSALAGRRSNLRRRSRSPSPSGPTRTRMTIFRSSVPPLLHGTLLIIGFTFSDLLGRCSLRCVMRTFGTRSCATRRFGRRRAPV